MAITFEELEAELNKPKTPVQPDPIDPEVWRVAKLYAVAAGISREEALLEVTPHSEKIIQAKNENKGLGRQENMG